jgi:hypothetical protein
VRWAARGKDAGSARIGSNTGATEDAASRRSSAALRVSRGSPSPPTS